FTASPFLPKNQVKRKRNRSSYFQKFKVKAALQGRAAAKKGIMTIGLIPEVQAFVEGLEPSTIPEERQEMLSQLAVFIQAKLDKKEKINLNFICTHNSRRSQLCQVWAQVAAYCFGVENLQT